MARTGVMIKFTARPGQGPALQLHLQGAARLATDEPGTELWNVHASPTEPDAVWLYECYESEQAKSIHEGSAEYKAVHAQTGSFLSGAPEVFPLSPLAGKGLGA